MEGVGRKGTKEGGREGGGMRETGRATISYVLLGSVSFHTVPDLRWERQVYYSTAPRRAQPKSLFFQVLGYPTDLPLSWLLKSVINEHITCR